METLNSFLADLTKTSQQALVSGAWLYPVHGVIYFVSHPSIYRSAAPIVGKCVLISLGITAGMFIFTYLPQLAFCAIFSGPLAFIPAAVMVFGESYALSSLVAKTFLLGALQDKIFDAVLLQKGQESLVARGREVKSSSSGVKTLGKSFTKPLDRFSKDGILRYLLSIPLNSIPVIGTVLFLLLNGKKSGPRHHSRYFQLKGFTKDTRAAFVEKNKGAYTAFGATSLALQLVPFVGTVFSITSTVGAALWANDLEKGPSQDSETHVKMR
ncbi:hypothetical protein E1B28_002665 [Marasmius oreades]|uniref:Outer spore wall protein RRT8 n=1 Tax=Marasmius oreades TaxID=181124 RepID=A0A9P7UL14_9AGAR|nr:uncharacterized protein E1B28_002665 [Marasmius oreades]KAG7086732.1 hypothetical protein E1B28_002665 [Marasmius oreades]